MKTLFVLIFTLIVGAIVAKAQSSSKIANILNTDTGANPPNITYSDGLPEGLWRKTATTNLRLGQNQIYGLLDSVANLRTAIGLKYAKTNPSNYISGITSALVIGALGYTPYSNANPNSYISSINSANVTSALGYTPYNGTTNPNGYINSVPAQSFSSLTGKPTTLSGYGITDAYPLAGNPSGFISSIPAQTWSSITGKPSFSSVATTGSYNDLTDKPTPPSTLNLTSGNGISITGTYPNLTVSLVAPTVSIATRTLNSNFTISSTKPSTVSYSISCTVTNPLLIGTSTATAYLEYSLNGGTTWLTPSQSGNSSAVGVTVAIQLTNTQTGTLTGVIPANALTRVRTATTGTASVAYVTGTEITY